MPRLGGVDAGSSAPGERSGPKRYIFVSNSLSDAVLIAAAKESSDAGATLVFRGIAPGATLAQAFARLGQLVQAAGGKPTVVIDPRLFAAYDVSSAPAVAVVEDDRWVKVSGVVTFELAVRRFDEGNFGDAGARGQTYEIIEPDFVQEMQRRMARIDFGEKKRQALARSWTNVDLRRLPVSDKTLRRFVDASVFVPHDVRDERGVLIAPGGTSFNPLDITPFNRTVVVFDPNDPRQVSLARRLADEGSRSHRPTVLAAVNLSTEGGWKGFSEHAKKLLPHRMFLLTQDLQERFAIRSVPTVVTADSTRFVVDEYDPAELRP